MARSEIFGVDIRRLRYFVAVCEHGGLSRAAGAIGIAQPALTRQIKLLEQELGLELFRRNGRGAVPNEVGISLLNGVRHHLDALGAVIETLRERFSGGPERINLGICPTIVSLFQDEIGEDARHGTGVGSLSVIEAYSGDLRSLMDAGELDLALTYAPAPTDEVKVTPLLSERLVVAAKELPGGETVSLTTLHKLKLILPSRIHQLRRIIDNACAKRDLTLVPALELDSLGTVKTLLADGNSGFATILPFHSVAHDAAHGGYETRFIDEPGMVRTIALLEPAHPRRDIPSGLAERIVSRAAEIRRTMDAVF